MLKQVWSGTEGVTLVSHHLEQCLLPCSELRKAAREGQLGLAAASGCAADSRALASCML